MSSFASVLKDMPCTAKIHLMEELWDDLCQDAANLPAPAWHGEVLATRAAKVATGTAQFFDWETVKASLLGVETPSSSLIQH